VTSAFVLELPPYRWPSLKGVLIHTWDRTSGMIRKAGTTILAVSIVMWLLLNLPWGVAHPRDSYFGRLSAAIAPAFEPLGFGSWDTAGALVSGFVAKEVVVSTMSQIYVGGLADAPAEAAPSLGQDLAGIVTGLGSATLDSGKILLSLIPGINVLPAETEAEDTSLSQALRARFTPLTAMALLVFVLLYVPCVATLSAIAHEFGRGWAAFSAIYQALVAWLAAFVVYQAGRLLGLG
jgi:ferrous iron transport protein B